MWHIFWQKSLVDKNWNIHKFEESYFHLKFNQILIFNIQ